MADPRDPRTTTRPVSESLDQIASGFDAVLQSQSAVLGEVLNTQRSIADALSLLSRRLDDRSTAGMGVGGVVPPPIPNLEMRRRQVRDMQDWDPVYSEWDPVDTQGRQSLTDFTIDPSRPLVAQSRKGIRQGVFAAIGARATRAAAAGIVRPGQFYEYDPSSPGQGGNLVELEDGFSYNAATGNYVDANGNFVRAEDALRVINTPEDRMGAARKAMLYGQAARVAEAWSAGQPIGRAITSALPAGALKAAGVAGAVVAVGNQGWQWVQGQYEANRRFQEVYGGSNLDQIDDRAAQWWNRNVTGRFSLLGGANYDALFNSGMQLGLRGSERSDYINVGADIMKTGVNAQQTTSILNMAIEAGQGLQGLAESIRMVNDAAKDAGINAARARDIFMKNYEAASSVMFGSPNARNFATYMTQGQLNQARPFQGISMAGSFQNESLQYLLAANAGMTPTQFMQAQRESPGGAIAITEDQIKQVLNYMPNPEGGPPIRQVVEEWLAANGGTYDPQVDQISLGNALIAAGWNPNVLARVLNTYGVNVTPATAPGYVGQMYTSQSQGQTALRSEAERRSQFTDGGTYQASGNRGTRMDFFGSMYDYLEKTTTDEGALKRAYASGLLGGERSVGGKSDWDALAGRQRMRGVEELITNTDELGLDADKTRVRVDTPSGKRVVTLEEALRYYPDQIQAGTAVILEGATEEAVNRSVGDVLGFPSGLSGDRATQRRGNGYRGSTTRDDLGETYDEYMQKREDEKKSDTEGGKNTTVVLELTPEARRLLQPVGGDPYMDPSAPSWDGYSIGNS